MRRSQRDAEHSLRHLRGSQAAAGGEAGDEIHGSHLFVAQRSQFTIGSLHPDAVIDSCGEIVGAPHRPGGTERQTGEEAFIGPHRMGHAAEVAPADGATALLEQHLPLKNRSEKELDSKRRLRLHCRELLRK